MIVQKPMNSTFELSSPTNRLVKNHHNGRRVVAVLLLLTLILLQTRPVFAGGELEYSIQVFATQEENSAAAEANRLRTNHQAAYLVKALIPGKGLFYRVRIGRFLTAKAAQTYAEALRGGGLITTFMLTGFEGTKELAYTDALNQSPQNGAVLQANLAVKVGASSRSKTTAINRASAAFPEPAIASARVKPDSTKQGVIANSAAPTMPTSGAANRSQPVPSKASAITITQKESAPRVKLTVHTTSLLTLDEAVSSLTILDSQIVAAELKDGRALSLTGLRQGETVIITFGRGGRRTLVIEVVSRPSKNPADISAEAARRARASRTSGFFNLYYSPSFDGNSSLLRQRFEYTQKLSNHSTLRTSGDWFKFFGGGGETRFSSLSTNFGMDRLTMGISRAASTLDMLDSQLDITPLSLYGYTLRGFHYSSNLAPDVRGLEIFGGLARPSPALFEGSEGYLAGALIPIKTAADFRLRVGAIGVAPHAKGHTGNGGLILQSDARYNPDDKTVLEGEIAYAENQLSWRSNLNLQRGAFAIVGETSRFDSQSPLISIGAQSGGRRANSLSLRWVPNKSFISTVSYNQVAYTPPTFTSRAALNNSSLFVSANFRIFNGSDIGLRFAEQKIETITSANASALELATQTATLTYHSRFNNRWSNLFETRLTTSQETSVGANVERGLSLREEMRRVWTRWTTTAYAHYNFNTPSLTGLVVRNVSLLPPLLRRAYEADPVGFLSANRGLLSSLLAGIELPETRSLGVGLRFQGAFSRHTVSGDVRYDGGQLLAHERRNLFATVSFNTRLDDANSVQFMASRSFLLGQKGSTFFLTASYTHRFGGGLKGFQFTELLGINEGHLQGRVFSDLNGNGQDEAMEPGVAGVKIQLNGNSTALTDAQGRYHFSSLAPGNYTVSMRLTDLGIRQRASTATEQNLSISGKQNLRVNFGITSFGFISGRVFNDLFLTGGQSANQMPGIAGVRLNLTALDSASRGEAQSRVVDAGGAYDFSNLAPGNYQLEVDAATLPPDFRLPKVTSWKIVVEPVKGHYQDIALAAQRAVSGLVFVDKDGDGQFDPQKDEVIENAEVVCGQQTVYTNHSGVYLLRNLPAGKTPILARIPTTGKTSQIHIELQAEPVFLRSRNILIPLH
jgi:hypothetical protein